MVMIIAGRGSADEPNAEDIDDDKVTGSNHPCSMFVHA